MTRAEVMSQFSDQRAGQMARHAALMTHNGCSAEVVVGYLSTQHLALTSAVARPRPVQRVARRIPVDL